MSNIQRISLNFMPIPMMLLFNRSDTGFAGEQEVIMKKFLYLFTTCGLLISNCCAFYLLNQKSTALVRLQEENSLLSKQYEPKISNLETRISSYQDLISDYSYLVDLYETEFDKYGDYIIFDSENGAMNQWKQMEFYQYLDKLSDMGNNLKKTSASLK